MEAVNQIKIGKGLIVLVREREERPSSCISAALSDTRLVAFVLLPARQFAVEFAVRGHRSFPASVSVNR